MSENVNTKSEKLKIISSLDSLKVPVWGLFWISMLAILYFAKSIFIPIFLALLVALTLDPLVSYLTKINIPKSLGSAFVLVLLSSIFVIGINYLSEPAGIWFERLPTEIRKLEKKVSSYKQSINGIQKTAASINKMTEIKDGKTKDNQKVTVKQSNAIYTIIDSTQSIFASTLIFLVLLYFLLANGANLTLQIGKYWFHQGFQTNILRMSSEAQKTVGKYLLYISLINITLGVIVSFVMWILGMPNPIIWGVTSAMLNFIPYVGPAINLSIISLVSLLTFDNTLSIILPPLVLLSLNIIEGQFVQPMVVGRMLTINPIIVFIFILFWGWLWGIAGIFMAVPILAVMNIIINQNLEQSYAETSNSPSLLRPAQTIK